MLTGAASLTASDTAASPVGTYPITAALGTLTAKNYIFAFTPGTLTITQAGASAYTITWPSQSIVYGTAIGGATGIKASASIAGSFTYSPAGVLPVSATAVAVTATFTPTDSVDYAGQSATAGITVTPATLTVAANNATRAFAAPDPSFSASITGYVNGDTAAVLTGAASLTASDTAASPVGTYPITAALGNSHGQELHLRLHPRHPHHHPGRRQRLHHHLAQPVDRLRHRHRRRHRHQGQRQHRRQLHLQPCRGASGQRHRGRGHRHLHPH